MPQTGDYMKAKVKVRTDLAFKIRRNTEDIDGKVFSFVFGWMLEDSHDRYPGEEAWLPRDPEYPSDAPIWLASGDLVRPDTSMR